MVLLVVVVETEYQILHGDRVAAAESGVGKVHQALKRAWLLKVESVLRDVLRFEPNGFEFLFLWLDLFRLLRRLPGVVQWEPCVRRVHVKLEVFVGGGRIRFRVALCPLLKNAIENGFLSGLGLSPIRRIGGLVFVLNHGHSRNIPGAPRVGVSLENPAPHFRFV